MSEKGPNNPEKKPPCLTDICDNCTKKYPLTPDNSVLFHYTTQDECDNLYCICPNCDYRTRIFIDDNTFQRAVDSGINLTVDKSAPPAVYSDWVDLKGISLPQTYEITDRHEALVQKFGENLLAIPDELFWDNIEADTERPYNERWL